MSAGPSRPPESSKRSMPESRTEAVCSPFAQLHGSCRAGRTAAICALFPGTPVIPGGAGNAGGFDFWGLLCGQGGTVAGNAPGAEAWRRICRCGARGVEPAFDGVHFSGAGHRLFARACFRPWRNASAQGLRREEGRKPPQPWRQSEAEAGQPAESRLQSNRARPGPVADPGRAVQKRFRGAEPSSSLFFDGTHHRVVAIAFADLDMETLPTRRPSRAFPQEIPC